MLTARKIGIVLWVVITLIFFIVLFIPNLEFNSKAIKFGFLYISTSALPFLLLSKSKEQNRKSLLWGVLLILGTFISQRVMLFFQFGSGFMTQEVIYRNNSNSNHRIEFQIEDIGALGYNRRTVEIQPFLFFQHVQDITIKNIDTTKWKFVGEYTNELQLKGG